MSVARIHEGRKEERSLPPTLLCARAGWSGIPSLLSPTYPPPQVCACRVQRGGWAGGLGTFTLGDPLSDSGTFWISLAVPCPPPKRSLNWAPPGQRSGVLRGRPSLYHGRGFCTAGLAVGIEESGTLAPPSFGADLTFTQYYHHRQKTKNNKTFIGRIGN